MINFAEIADRVANWYSEHDTEVKFWGGAICSVGAMIFAGKAALKINEVADETKATMDRIHEAKKNGQNNAGSEYTPEDAKKDTVAVAIQTTGKIIKAAAPAIGLEVASLILYGKCKASYETKLSNLSTAYMLLEQSVHENKALPTAGTVTEDGEVKVVEKPVAMDVKTRTFRFAADTSSRYSSIIPKAVTCIEGTESMFNTKLRMYKGKRITLDSVLDYLGFYDRDIVTAMTEEQRNAALVLGWVNNGDANPDPNKPNYINIDVRQELDEVTGTVDYYLTFNCYPIV